MIAALRISDPKCRRHPEVCGQVAEHHNPDSFVCQLPNGHSGEHWRLAEPQQAGLMIAALRQQLAALTARAEAAEGEAKRLRVVAERVLFAVAPLRL